MKKATLFLLFLLTGINTLSAQNEYLVKTDNKPRTVVSEEEEFLTEHFPLIRLCDWQPGMKFMIVPDKVDMIISTFKLYDSKKDVENSTLKYKIFEFTGTEEDSQSLRFLFRCDGINYYHEIKYKKLESYCREKPKADIKTLAYLGDVDIAKEALTGKVLYTRTSNVRIDDSNAYNGYLDIKIPRNTKVTVTAVGVGNKECPVKVVFTDDKGKSYYTELAFSKTNTGMDIEDFQTIKKYFYFPNAFSFTDAKDVQTGSLENKYLNRAIYSTEIIELEQIRQDGTKTNTAVKLPKYTILTIARLKYNSDSNVTLTLKDNKGNGYSKQVTFTYNAIVKPENFFEDLFVLGNIRDKYPSITEETWILISKGEVKNGMTKDECRLALGKPNLVRQSGNNGEFEEWVYRNRMLTFDKGKLTLRNK